MSKRKVEPNLYVYKGLNARGRKIRGELSEETLSLAKIYLKNQGITVQSIRKRFTGLSLSQKIKPHDVTLVARQLATMLASGIALVQSLTVMSQNIEKYSVKQMILQLKADIEGGSTFTQALRKYPEHFDSLFCSMVEAGERSGSLEIMLDRVATYKEKSEILQMKVKKAFKYPIFIFAVSMIITAILLVKVIPVFQGLFESVNSELPAITRIIIQLSEFVQAYGIYGLAALVVAVVMFKRAMKTNVRVQHSVQRMLLHMPIFGDILKKSIIARFSRTLSTTFAVGLPLIDALDASGKATGNIVYEEVITDIRNDVIGGQQLNFALRNSMVFSGMVVQMTSIGEESGQLESMLNKVANYYEAEVDNAIDGLTSMLEPLIIVFLGFIVGTLVLAMYMPIFMMGKAF